MVTPDGMSAGSGLPHQHLLVSVAQAMGLEGESVGLASVQSRQGDRIELIGPLSGMA